MNLKLIALILLIAAVPVVAQAQTPIVTKADAQKVVDMISHDKAKTQTFCDLSKLNPQLQEAKAKNDTEKFNELGQKTVELMTTLGPEYKALWMGYTPEIGSVITDGVHNLCAK